MRCNGTFSCVFGNCEECENDKETCAFYEECDMCEEQDFCEEENDI